MWLEEANNDSRNNETVTLDVSGEKVKGEKGER